jgi:VWFA-related protein
LIHGFTSDTAQLVDALNKVKGELSTMENVNADTQAAAATGSDLTYSPLESLSNTGSTDAQLNDFISNGDAAITRLQQDRAIESTFAAFQDIAFSLSGIPGKKSLIWATGGFPFYFDSPAAVPYGRLGYMYERAVQSLADAEISVYPVDVRGLTNNSLAGDASYSLVGRHGRSTATGQFARNWLLNSSLDSLRDFAEMTGGRAFYNSNDVSAGFQRAVNDGSHYYLLSYYLDTTNTKAGWRQLKVKLHRPGTEVRARGGFFVTGATTNPEQTRKIDIASALDSPFDSTGIPLSVRFKDVTQDGQRKKVSYVLHVAPEGITIGGNHGTVNLDVVGIAVNEKRTADNFVQTVEGDFKADMLAKLRTEGLAYNNVWELAPGQYTVRFVVRDNFSGKVGSLTAPLTVN